jgi:predicted nucleic acid-binding protein
MRTALDTNIISSIWSSEPTAAHLSEALAAAKQAGGLAVSPVTYAELLAYPLATEPFVQSTLARMGIAIDFATTEAVWTEAGIRYAQYAERRRRSEKDQPRRLVPDFFVGAHALLQADQLITRDMAFYQRNFPELRLYPLSL